MRSVATIGGVGSSGAVWRSLSRSSRRWSSFIELQPSPPPLALPKGHSDPPAGPLDGTWRVAPGSVAGFRVQETAVGFSDEVVGRTSLATETVVVSNDSVTAATFRIDPRTITVNGKTESQFEKASRRRPIPTPP